MTFETFVGVPLAVASAAVSVLGAIAALGITILANRSLESKKAELVAEIEKLKGELSKETESHKFTLKKKDVLFGKEIEAAVAYFDLYSRLEPRYSHPDKDWSEVITEVLEGFTNMSSKIATYLAVHGVFLSTDNRADLEDVEQTASIHQFTTHGVGSYNEADSASQAERVLTALKGVRSRFVLELRN
jgi:hypothetical protein